MSKRDSSKPGLSPWPVVVGLALVARVAIAQADTYLIISLLGDHLTVVTPVAAVGSRLDTNRYETVPLGDTDLDDFAVRTAAAVVSKERPDDKLELLRAVDPSLRKMSGAWIDAGSINVEELVTLIADTFKPPPDSHVLLIVPRRDELELKTDHDYRGGHAKVAGLGFYVDNVTRFADSKEIGFGFLGIFANFQLALINLQTRSIESQQRAVTGTTRAASRAADKNPWNALTGAQKVATLKSLMKGEIERVLPGMLGVAKP
jgi:hypothetical protein